MSAVTYRTFIRSGVGFPNWIRARKRTDRRHLTGEEAVARTNWWNANRTRRQIARGTMMEFERE